MLKDIKRRVSLCNTATPPPPTPLAKDQRSHQRLQEKRNLPSGPLPPPGRAPISRRNYEKQRSPTAASPAPLAALTSPSAKQQQQQHSPPRQPRQKQPIHTVPTRPASMPLSNDYESRASTISPASLQTLSNRRSSTSGSSSVNSNDLQLLLDHSHLKPGAKAALLSYDRTIDMYRENAKKTNNPDFQCDFAIFLVEAAKQQQQQQDDLIVESTQDDMTSENDYSVTNASGAMMHPQRDSSFEYLFEAEKLLKQVALRGHAESQYYLANMYASGLLHKPSGGKSDFDKAFPYFVRAAKHHHPDAAFRTARCYEDGLGTRRDKAKAAQYYRKAASLNHPGAMYRLGLAEMNGELGITRNPRDGHKWLKRSAEAATPQYPHALHELAILHEKGFENIIFVDPAYAVDLYNEASALGYAPSAFRLGECYEHGHLACDVNLDMSIAYYTIAADQGHAEACFALTACYLMGTPTSEPSEEQAFTWACRAATKGLPKAEYAVGYFCEVGIGIPHHDIEQAIQWYTRAAQKGEKRAAARLRQVPAHYRGSSNGAVGGPINMTCRTSPPKATPGVKQKKSQSAILTPPASVPPPLTLARSNSLFTRAKKGLLGSPQKETPPPIPSTVVNFV